MRGIHVRRSRSGQGRVMIGGAVLLAIVLFASCSETGSSAPSGDAGSASSDVRILNDCPELPCQGPLEPGDYRWQYRSTPNEPTIAFTIPSPGWTWYYSGSFRIVADESPTIHGLYSPDGIYFLRDPAIAARDCEEAAAPGIGRSVEDLVAWLEAAPGLVVGEPTPITIGGLDGMQLDLQIDPAWKRTCFFSERLPAVPLIFRGAELGGYHSVMLPDMSMRWFVLDSEDGVIIVDIEDGPDGLAHDELLRTGSEMVGSLVFSEA
jgi:hypothetical protein